MLPPNLYLFIYLFIYYLLLKLNRGSHKLQPSRCTRTLFRSRHFPDLGSASSWSCFVGNLIQPIRSTTQISVVMRHQHGISAFVSQTSFGGEASDSVAKCISAVFLSYLISTSLEVLSESQKLISLQSVLQMTFVKLHDWWFHVQVKNERTADTVRKLPAIIC